MYFSSDCFLESVGNCQSEKFTDGQKNLPQIIKVSPHFGVSVPYFHGGYSEGHFEVRAMSGRGSTVSERYQPTINEKPFETSFQRVLLDFVLKTFGLGAENETRTRDPNLGKVVLYQLSYFRNTNILKFYDYNLFDCECKGTTNFLFSKFFRNFFTFFCNFFCFCPFFGPKTLKIHPTEGIIIEKIGAIGLMGKL